MQKIIYDSNLQFQINNVIYIPEYINLSLQQELFNYLLQAQFVRVQYEKYGKVRNTPRLTWCYGQYNNNPTASYKGKVFQTEPIPLWLNQIKDPIEKFLNVTFNAVILNKYENGEDHISWHQDDEKFLEHHIIASISIGVERDFQIKDSSIHEIKLKSGSLLIFNGVNHSLPKRKNQNGVRFNITFRKVKDNLGIGNYYYYSRGKEFFI